MIYLFVHDDSLTSLRFTTRTEQLNKCCEPLQKLRVRLGTCKIDDFDFDIVNFPFLDGDVPRRASYGAYISQLIRFARICNHVTDINARNKCLTAKLLQQGYRYRKLRIF